MPLSPIKHVYELIPLVALALKLRCKMSSLPRAIVGIAPFVHYLQFVSYTNEGRNNDVNRKTRHHLSG